MTRPRWGRDQDERLLGVFEDFPGVFELLLAAGDSGLRVDFLGFLVYRGTSPIRKGPTLGPDTRPMRMAL